jgi:putative ABC transport system ATP-binding protein
MNPTPSQTAPPAPGDLGSTMPVLRAIDVTRNYGTDREPVKALDGVTLTLDSGSFTAVMGPSGSGKSTLLQCVSGLDRPDTGSVWLGDTELTRLSEARLTQLRRRRIGFVFQSYNLMPALSAAQNIRLPARLGGHRIDETWMEEVVAATGLASLMRRRPAQLSGGQQQRVATARALVGKPQMIVADEPTGALDSHTAADLLDLLRHCVDVLGQTVLMVTHDPGAAATSDQVTFMRDGRIAGTLSSPTTGQINDFMLAWERR